MKSLFIQSFWYFFLSIFVFLTPLFAASFSSEQEIDGVGINFKHSETIRVGETAFLYFNISDSVTKQPIRGLRPESSIRKNFGEGNLSSCAANMLVKTRRFGSHTPVQLNSDIIALNTLDKSLSVIDPGRMSLMFRKKIPLDGVGNDMALPWLGQFIYVTVEPSTLTVIDAVHMKTTHQITVGASPHHLLVQPDGKYIWVGNDGDASVSVIATDTHKLIATIPVGHGHHELAVTKGSRYVAVTNQDDNTVTVISVRNLAPVGTVAVGKKPHGIAYGSLSRSFYVANEGDGTVTVIDISKGRVTETIPTGLGVRTVRFDNEGRLAYALNRQANTATIIDSTTSSVIDTIQTGVAPDDIVFEYDWAFIRNAGSPNVTIISLNHRGLFQNFPVGHREPSQLSVPQEHTSLVSFGDGHNVLVPNPPDGAVYQMMAGSVVGPSRIFTTKGLGTSRAVVYWKGLREVTPGLYRRALTFEQPGRHEIGLYVSSPEVSTCFELLVEPALTGNTQ